MCLFWISYIVAAIIFYHIFRCVYVKTGRVTENDWGDSIYHKTATDPRKKYPLYVWILGIFVYLLPILNVFALTVSLVVILFPEIGITESSSRYYCKSIFTKEY